MKAQMKAMQWAVTAKEKKQGPVMPKGITSEDCNLLDMEGYEEYDVNYGDLKELFANAGDFPNNE